jgi:oligopeptide transport system substrate-binding protein
LIPQDAKRGLLCLAATIALFLPGCGPSGSEQSNGSKYFGKVQPPARQVLRYISGSEPESLDPHIGSGQPEARIYMALFTGLVEYHPQTGLPIPDLAEKWTINENVSQFTFHLRKGLHWSNGDPLNAHDFVYSFRRGLSPALAARNAYLAYEIKYAQAYNEGQAFVRDRLANQFLLEQGFGLEAAAPENQAFNAFISAPPRLTVPADATQREKLFAANAPLKTACAGKEFIPVNAEDIGVEAVDDLTFRVTLRQSAPYFLGLMAHQFFRAVPRCAIEKHGNHQWARPGHIVTCGAFTLSEWKPYNVIAVKRDPLYWDAARVKLEQILFYPLEDTTTMLNLYKAGAVDATYNHTVPVGWLDKIKTLADYMDAPEICSEFYQFNTTEPPVSDVRVRKALALAIDRNALARFRKAIKPPLGFAPGGIFPGYPHPGGNLFDPEHARRLLAAAGYADAGGKYEPGKFPVADVELVYNTSESNRQVAEFVQAQWKQNLGLTIPLKNMEWKTFLQARANREFKGVARSGWIGDYLDPYSFLALFTTEAGDNGTGWFDREYVRMLQQANEQLDGKKRYELLARAEAYLLDAQPVIPLGTQSTSWMKKPYLKGMYPNPMTLHAWKYVYIEHNPDRWDRGVPSLKPEAFEGSL